MKKRFSPLALARLAARSADDKLGIDIAVLNVKRMTLAAEYFVIITALSPAQINAITQEIERRLLNDTGLLPLHRDGRHATRWTAIDYGGFVAHIFSREARDFYALEKLWTGARRIAWKTRGPSRPSSRRRPGSSKNSGK